MKNFGALDQFNPEDLSSSITLESEMYKLHYQWSTANKSELAFLLLNDHFKCYEHITVLLFFVRDGLKSNLQAINGKTKVMDPCFSYDGIQTNNREEFPKATRVTKQHGCTVCHQYYNGMILIRCRDCMKKICLICPKHAHECFHTKKLFHVDHRFKNFNDKDGHVRMDKWFVQKHYKYDKITIATAKDTGNNLDEYRIVLKTVHGMVEARLSNLKRYQDLIIQKQNYRAMRNLLVKFHTLQIKTMYNTVILSQFYQDAKAKWMRNKPWPLPIAV